MLSFKDVCQVNSSAVMEVAFQPTSNAMVKWTVAMLQTKIVAMNLCPIVQKVNSNAVAP